MIILMGEWSKVISMTMPYEPPLEKWGDVRERKGDGIAERAANQWVTNYFPEGENSNR